VVIIENRIKTLELLAEATSDPGLSAAALRAMNDLKVQAVLVKPTRADHAEEARIAEEERAEEERVRLARLDQLRHERFVGRIIDGPAGAQP
jgi:hypothetical protein